MRMATNMVFTVCMLLSLLSITCNMPQMNRIMGTYTCSKLVGTACAYHSILTIHCNTGYRLSGFNSSQCIDTERWSKTIGVCEAITCNMPQMNRIMGTYTCSKLVGTACAYHSILTIHCNTGYRLSGFNSSQCIDTERWSKTIGVCEAITCNMPQMNRIMGTYTCSKLVGTACAYHSILTIHCNTGYRLSGFNSSQCIDTERWSKTIGVCEVKRSDKPPSQIAHGVFIFKGGLRGIRTYNKTVSLNCSEGYKRNDSFSKLRCADDETLVKRCDTPPSEIAHGVLIFKDGLGGKGTYNTTVSLNCSEGYKLDNLSQLRCAEDEQYHGTLGRCLVKRCDTPPSEIAHGVLMFKDGLGGNGTYNTTVSLNCSEGYKLDNFSQLRCAEDEQYHGTLGRCLVKRCDKPPPQIDNGLLIFEGGLGGNGTYNTTVSLSCSEGYKRNDSFSQLRCSADEKWQGTLGLCLESVRDGEPESGVAGIAGGVTATIVAVILGVIIAFVLYRRRARGQNDKVDETTLNTIPSSSRRKGHSEEVILDTSIYAQPNKLNVSQKRPEIDETKIEYMNSNDRSSDYYSSTPQKVTGKHSIRVDDLSSFFLSRKMEPRLYEEEYSKLPNGLTKLHDVALLPENKSKNRYKNIYPYNDTRVKLEIWDPNIENDYINACYINGFRTVRAYIAAQGPTKDIVNDFWRMIWQTKCSKIVMLTNLIEDGKHKCEQYWPHEGSVEYGDIVIRLIQCETFSDFTIRTLELRKTLQGREEKNMALQVKQFHFTAWPDRGVPRFASSLVHFRHKIHITKTRRNSEGPIVVHCSAGIGRTGTFLALDYLVDQAEEMGYINVVHCVENLRKQRVNLVQTLEQYIFVHEALVEALTCTTIAMSTSEFQENYRKLLEKDTKTGKRKLDEAFEKLPMYVSDPGEDVYVNAKDMENLDKNRYSNILPDKNHCPYLNVYVKGRDAYINAVFLPAYKLNDIFVVTQTPLENTIVDFWRMVYQLEVSSIVMLNTLSEMKEEERYWTENEETLEIAPFRITLESKTSDDICTNYTMLLKYHHEHRRVRLSRATYWADKKNVPKSPTEMLKQIDLIQKWQQETCNKPIVVHCMNGAERSGLFCVVSALLERTKIEQDVAVEQIIKQMRSRRPQVIPNVDQFKFCYDAVSAYLDQFDTYSNFSGL